MAKALPMSLLQFQKEFATEEQCAKYLAYKRWKDGFVCSKCEHHAYYYIQTRQLYECQACHYQLSVTAGTLLHKTKLPLTTWFWAFYLLAHDKRGKSALSLSQILGLNYRTAQRMMRKIRAAMADQEDQYKLSGTVDMDDAYFGAPRKSKDGRGTNMAKAVIALSKDKKNRPQYLCVQVIESVSIEEIKRVTQKLVEPGSIIVSDGHASYKPLAQEGYRHKPKVYYKEDEEEFLKSLHTVISNIKAFIQGTFHGLGANYLQSYFDEFCFRFNRRFDPNQIFDRFTECLCLDWPAPAPLR